MYRQAVHWSPLIGWSSALGLLPLLFALAATVYPPAQPFDPMVFERAVLGYGVLILGFLGGVRWGLRILGGQGSDLTFVMGILGAVVGCLVLVLPFAIGLAVLIAGFAAHGAWDVWSGARGGVPHAYARLRMTMTFIVCLLLAGILLAHGMSPAMAA